MLVFLIPTALFGLALLAVPILLHLFKPRKVREIPFSSLRWLRASQHRLSRRIRWHQIVLFLLRAALIILMVLALARPLFSTRRGPGKAERFIILDVSRTMRYANPDGSRPFDTGRAIAEKLLMNGSVGDRSTLLLVGNETESAGPLIDDPSLYLARLRSTRPGMGEGDFSGALTLISSLLVPHREGSAVELYFITANLSRQWTQSALSRFLRDVDTPIRVHVVNVGPDHPKNAWIAGAEFLQSDHPLRRAIRIRVAAVGDDDQVRTVRLTSVAGMPEMARKVTLKTGVPVSLEFEIPLAVNLKGQVALVALEPRDALESDDRYWINLDWHGMTRILVIEPETTQIPELQSGYHLRTALEALAYADQGALDTIRRSDVTVTAEDISGADVIVMDDVPALTDERLAQLEERVKSGAGLVIFLGPSIRDDFYGTRFFNPVRASGSLFSAHLGEFVDLQKRHSDLAILGDIQWNHPIMAPFSDPAFSDLQKVRFRGYRRLLPVENRSDVRTLATIQGQVPAILESSTGAGKVLLFNTTANDLWSDLPRRKSFVPLIDRILFYLVGGLRHGTLMLGDAAVIPLRDAVPHGTATVTTPGGQTLHSEIQMLSGRAVLRVPALQEPGVYKVAYATLSGTLRFPLVIDTARRDSAMTPADRTILQRWWKPAEFEMTVPTLAGHTGDGVEKRLALDPLLMILALLVFLAEMFLVHIYCPRAHPRVVVDSSVARKGFFGGGLDKT